MIRRVFLFSMLPLILLGQTPPFAGEWKLVHELSYFGEFAPPQSASMSFTFNDYGEVRMCAVSAQWQENCSHHVFNGDGRVYDGRVGVKKINPEFSVAEAVHYRNSKISTRRWFQVKGNTLTVTTNTLDEQGKVAAIVTLVYKRE